MPWCTSSDHYMSLHVSMEPTHVFTGIDPNDNKRPDFTMTSLHGRESQFVADVASTGIHGQSRRHNDDPCNLLEVEFEQKIINYGEISKQKWLY